MKKLNIALISLAIFGVSLANATECPKIEGATLTGSEFTAISDSIDNTMTDEQTKNIVDKFKGDNGRMPLSAYTCNYTQEDGAKSHFTVTYGDLKKSSDYYVTPGRCQNPTGAYSIVYLNADGIEVSKPQPKNKPAGTDVAAGLNSYKVTRGITQHIKIKYTAIDNCVFTITKEPKLIIQ